MKKMYVNQALASIFDDSQPNHSFSFGDNDHTANIAPTPTSVARIE